MKLGKYSLGAGDRFGDPAKAQLRAFIAARHVHAQTDCRSCWARYLCAGGCHQEAAARTSSSCDFIRGWLEFCLASYCELIERRPDYFSPAHHPAPEVSA